jgi:hypothetical protein
MGSLLLCTSQAEERARAKDLITTELQFGIVREFGGAFRQSNRNGTESTTRRNDASETGRKCVDDICVRAML